MLDPYLNTLSTEALNELQGKIIAILDHRKKSELRYGAVASFMHDGERTYIMVERINQKSISGMKIDPVTGVATRQKLRVSPSLLQVESSPPWLKKPVVSKPISATAGSDRPRSAAPTF